MTDDELRADLDAWMDDPDPEPLHGDRLLEDYRLPAPADQDAANRMLRKRSRLIAEQQRVIALADAEQRQRQAWVDDRCAGITRQLEWLDRGLEGFARATLPVMRRKSLPLPSGTLKLTAPGQHSLHVVDEAAFVEWVEADLARHEFVKREPKVVAAAVKAACALGPKVHSDSGIDVFSVVDGSGEIVPGVRFTKPSDDRFSVTAPAYDDDSNNPPKER